MHNCLGKEKFSHIGELIKQLIKKIRMNSLKFKNIKRRTWKLVEINVIVFQIYTIFYKSSSTQQNIAIHIVIEAISNFWFKWIIYCVYFYELYIMIEDVNYKS